MLHDMHVVLECCQLVTTRALTGTSHVHVYMYELVVQRLKFEYMLLGLLETSDMSESDV